MNKEFEKQISLFDGSAPFKIDKPIRLIELFAGVGSQAAALSRLQDEGLCTFEHYRICEFDKYAVKSYNAIHGTDFQTSDITQIKGEDLGITETDKFCYIMTYSFPCTDLSLAGKQEGMAKGSGTRSGLLWEVERLLNEIDELPQVLLMENVPQVICEDFFEWCRFLENKGYKNYYKLMNAKNYGVPQNRNRCFMVSLLGDYLYEFPAPFPLEKRFKDIREKKIDKKYYLSKTGIKHFEKQANNRGDTLLNYAELKIINLAHGQSKGSVINAEIFPTLDTQTSPNWHTVLLEPLILDEQNGYIREDGTVGTITTDESSPKHSNRVIEDTSNIRIRKLTPKECFRLMDFDDEDFEKASKVNSDSQLYKQAGNSIVVNCLYLIFKEMM